MRRDNTQVVDELLRGLRSLGRRIVTLGLGTALILGGVAMVVGARRHQEATLRELPEVGREVPATAMNPVLGPANNSPDLAVDPTEPRFTVLANRLDAPDFDCALQVSGNGGRGWIPVNAVPKLPHGADKCYAPEVAFDRKGILYYLFVGLAGRGNEPMGAFLTRSSDRGRTFTAPYQVLGPLNFGVRMAIDSTIGDDGRLHLTWLHGTADPTLGGFGAPPNPVMTAHSDDGGRTFSTPLRVSDPIRQRVVAPVLTLGPDHLVHVGYYDLGDDARDYQGLEGPTWEGNWSFVVATSSDGGEHFGAGSVVDDAVRPPERVMLIFTMPPAALVSHRERLCAAWTDARHGDPDALLRCSSDGGRTWGNLHRLNDDPLGNGRTQYLPQLSMSANGRLDAVFYDRRGDPQNRLNDVFYTYSPQEGHTFIGNVRLTHRSSNSQIGQQYLNASAQGQFELGSRLGLLSVDSGAIAAWTDTRNSKAGTTDQAIFLVDVSLPAAPGATALLVLGVGLLLTGGMIAGLTLLRDRRLREGVASVVRRGTERTVIRRKRIDHHRFQRWRKVVLGLGGLAVLAVVIGQLETLRQEEEPLPPSPPVIEVTMVEYHLEYNNAIPAGRVVFRFRNAGRFKHAPVLVPLSEDVPPIDQQLRSKERRGVRPFGEVPPLAPGETGTFAIDLVSGQRYAILDLAQSPDGDVNAVKGMNGEFRAGGASMPPPTDPPLPPVDSSSPSPKDANKPPPVPIAPVAPEPS